MTGRMSLPRRVAAAAGAVARASARRPRSERSVLHRLLVVIVACPVAAAFAFAAFAASGFEGVGAGLFFAFALAATAGAAVGLVYTVERGWHLPKSERQD